MTTFSEPWPHHKTIYHIYMQLKVVYEFFTQFMAGGVGVELLIKHEAKLSALSRNKTPTPSAINRMKNSYTTLNDIQ